MRKCLGIAPIFGFAALVSSVGWAAEVRGILAPKRAPRSVPSAAPGYVRVPLTRPNPAFVSVRVDRAVFLRSIESLPIAPPTEPARLRIRGEEVSPSVVSCAVDGKVEISNDDAVAYDLTIAGQTIGAVEPGSAMEYTCAAGASGPGLIELQAAARPYIRAKIYVGEIGVAAALGTDGRFRLTAPDGSYRLLWVTALGVEGRMDVDIAGRDVDVGALGGNSTEEAQP